MFDSSASLENSLPTSDVDSGESKTVIKISKGHSTALMPDRTCSTSTSTPASLHSEVDLAGSNAVVWGILPMSPTAPGNIGLHQTRPEDPIRLYLNRPPSVKPPSWLGHSTIPQIRSAATLPLLHRLESLRLPPTRPSSFSSSSTHPNLPSLITRTTEISVPSTTVYTSPQHSIADTDSIERPFHPSVPHSLSLPSPGETFHSSASSSLDSPSQEFFGGQSNTIDSPAGQQTHQGNSSTLLLKDESNLSDTAP